MMSRADNNKEIEPDQPIHKGIRIKWLTAVLFVAALIAMVITYVEAAGTVAQARALYELEQQRQRCDDAIQSFMDGSDYLTYQVGRFVSTGDRQHMDAYWTEVYETRSRDLAVADILEADISAGDRQAALSSKEESDRLIEGETWAMRMICESQGLALYEMPEDVKNCQLSPEDQALPAAEKQAAALAYVFGPDYSSAKDTIRSNVQAFRNGISDHYSQAALAALSRTEQNFWSMEVLIVVFMLVMLWVIFLYARQVASPLMRLSRQLTEAQDGRPIHLQQQGAREIRQFAAAFNTLYAQVEEDKERLRKLGYIDYLTSVPNRASITEYVEEAIARGQHGLGLMIVDVDDFKRFNDTYGHAVGDRTLQQIARAIVSAQPEGEGLAGRLCGEEFVVVRQKTTPRQLDELAQVIMANVRGISGTDVGLEDAPGFRVTVSLGGAIWSGEEPTDFARLLARADQGLYLSKGAGKDKYTWMAG